MVPYHSPFCLSFLRYDHVFALSFINYKMKEMVAIQAIRALYTNFINL